MFRALVYILLTLFVLTLVRMMSGIIMKGVSDALKDNTPSPSADNQGPRSSAGGALHRDPVCGTFVAEASAVSLRAGGTTHYFCSEACRKQFQA